MRPIHALAPMSLVVTTVALVLVVPRLARADANVTTLDGRAWAELIAELQSDAGSQGRVIALCVRQDGADRCAPCGSSAFAFDDAGSRAFAVGACDSSSGATEVELVDRSALFDDTATGPTPRALTMRAWVMGGVVTTSSIHSPAIIGPGFGRLEPLEGIAGGTTDFTDPRRGCVGHFQPAAQHTLQLRGDVRAMSIRAIGERHDLTLGVRTADGEWHCNDDGAEWPHRLDPIVRLLHPPPGRVDIWVGTSEGETDIAYVLDVEELGTTYVDRPDATLLVSGILMQTFSWAMLASLDGVPTFACDASCPNDTWRQLAWVPLIGPWLGETVDGSRSNSFSVPAIVDAALQDAGLIFVILSVLLRREREVPTVSLGVSPDAPRLVLGGGAGTSLGATLAF